MSCQARGRKAAPPGAEPPAETPRWGGGTGVCPGWGPLFVGKRGDLKRSGSLISGPESHTLIVCQDQRVRWKGWSCSKPRSSLFPGSGPFTEMPERRCWQAARTGAAVWGGPGGVSHRLGSSGRGEGYPGGFIYIPASILPPGRLAGQIWQGKGAGRRSDV